MTLSTLQIFQNNVKQNTQEINMIKRYFFFPILIIIILCATNTSKAQNEPGEKVQYYQMEPLNDSLFVKIQSEVFIDPPDPKAEIIVDLRDPNNQTVSIRGQLYPFLAFTPETRAKIITYPFKINLEENINYGSVFTRVIEKTRLNKIFQPPSLIQISSTLSYINPFVQLFGGERFGIPIKNDIGISMGLGTPYSGPLETNFVEGNFHILGFRLGVFSFFDGLTQIKTKNNTNNLYAVNGYQVGYVFPLGNFFEISYQSVFNEPTSKQLARYQQYDIDSLNQHAKILHGSYYSWELRYPISVMGSTRAKFYIARYLYEWHLGFTGREMSLAGSTFDFSFDAMPSSDVRQPQYVMNIMVEKIADNWAASAFALGPSVVYTKDDKGKYGIVTIMFNLRIKVGTSL